MEYSNDTYSTDMLEIFVNCMYNITLQHCGLDSPHAIYSYTSKGKYNIYLPGSSQEKYGIAFTCSDIQIEFDQFHYRTSYIRENTVISETHSHFKEMLKALLRHYYSFSQLHKHNIG